jgi:hypothetical protein
VIGFVAEDATYTANNKHKRKSCMPSAGFVSTIPAVKTSPHTALPPVSAESALPSLYWWLTDVISSLSNIFAFVVKLRVGCILAIFSVSRIEI